MKKAKYIISIQGDKCFLRCTEFTVFDANKVEFRYAAKPVKLSRAPKHIQAALKKVTQLLKETNKGTTK